MIIDAAFNRSRAMVLIFIMIVLAGASAYLAIPKESEPDVAIPVLYVSMHHEGISPKDAERILLMPMQKELQGIEGIKEIKGVAAQGYASVTLIFDAGFQPDKALQKVRERVDIAKSKLPAETDEPRINEINVALFPVLAISLSGPLPERSLLRIARDLKEKIEAVKGVLEVNIRGDREEVMEVLLKPNVMQSYGLSFNEIGQLLQRNNRLVAAGELDTGSGRFMVKVPGLIDSIDDVMNLPIKTSANTIVRFKDIATVRQTFKDPDGFARLNGQNALVIEISKRVGANIIETIGDIKQVVDGQSASWPNSLAVNYLQDKSVNIKDMLGDLQNNVIAAIVIVVIVMIAVLGVRSGLLVGLAIPGSFLAGILLLYIFGYTMNMVVLFSLILVAGMLVDGAIVTIEMAQCHLNAGFPPKEAYSKAAKQMSWPIITSTATTLMVFLPLLFWPGVVGDFMKYLPITVLCTLSASLLMALLFIPILGGVLQKSNPSESDSNGVNFEGAQDLKTLFGVKALYLKSLYRLLMHPGKTLGFSLLFMIASYLSYGFFGNGVEFFPQVDPDYVQVQVKARGNLSIYEKDLIVRRVEKELSDLASVKTSYAKTIGAANGSDHLNEDVIGVIQLEFKHWSERPPGTLIIEKIRNRLSSLAGIKIEVRKQESGPSNGKPIQLVVSNSQQKLLTDDLNKIRKIIDASHTFIDVEDNRAIPGIEWQLNIDREQASLFGADVSLLGGAVQMVTNGLKISEYQPPESDKEVDIRLRFPAQYRNLDELNQLTLLTDKGQVPIRNFLQFAMAPKTGTIQHSDGKQSITIEADVKPDLLVDDQINLLKQKIKNERLNPNTTIKFKGETEDQEETGAFLTRAFYIAIFSMALILLMQFNSFAQTVIVLSAIVLSTAGVLIGLMLTGHPFGIVMGGIGVIALAGIVVNNNIVLIDTYNVERSKGYPSIDALLRTAEQRLRPVLLTSFTTVLGLVPMVFALNIDLIHRHIAIGAPSSQWWEQLASAIAGGLSFATLLTLFLTPCLLLLSERLKMKLMGTKV